MRSHRCIRMAVVEEPESRQAIANQSLDGRSVKKALRRVLWMVVQQLLCGFVAGRQVRRLFYGQQILPLGLSQLRTELDLPFHRSGKTEYQIFRRWLLAKAE